MALVDFSLPASDPNNPNGVTSASDLQRRLLAAQLMQKNGSDTSPIQSPWQGAARMVQAALGGWDEGQLNKQAAAGAKANSDALAAALGGIGGGSVTATPAAAPAASADAGADGGALPSLADGQIKGMLSIGGNQYAFGSGGVPGHPHIPFGDYPVTPDAIGPWGQAHGALGINNGVIPDAELGRDRTGIELHAGSSDKLITEGCLAIAGSQWPQLKQQITSMISQNGPVTLHVGPEGATIAPKNGAPAQTFQTAPNAAYGASAYSASAPQSGAQGALAAALNPNGGSPVQVASLGSLSGIGGGGAALPATAPLPPPRPANLGAAPAQVASNADSEDDATPAAPAGGQVAALPPSAAPQPQAVPTAPARPAIDTQKLLAVISSPYSTPAQQQIATALLQSAMKQDQYSAPYKDQFGNVVQRAANGELKVINAAEKPESDLWQATPDGMMYNKKTGEVKQGTSGGKPFLMGEDRYGGKIYGTMKNGVPTPLQQQPDQGAASAPANPNLHGEEFLQTLDPGMAGQVRSIIEGRTPYPTGMLLKTPYGERLSTYVTQADPTFEAGNATARVAARKEFLSGGPSSPAGVITAGNTALQHLGDLSDAAEQLGNYNTTIPGNNLLNAGRNALMAGDNAVPLARFNNTVAKYVDEATKFYRGAGGTEADIQRDIKNLSPNMSPSELRAAIDQSATLMQGKINALQDRWHKAMGPMVPDIPIVQPESQAALSRIQQRAQPGGPAAGGDPLSQARAAIAAGAPRGAVIQRLQQHGIDPSGL